MDWQQLVHWLPWVYCQMEPSIYHHISPFARYVKFGLATGPDLLIKSTWASLFSADISITLPTYHFLAYSPRMYWPGFGNTMSGLDSTICIPILSTCLCLCLVIYCSLTVFPHPWAQIHGTCVMLYLIWSLHLETWSGLEEIYCLFLYI